MTKVLQRPAFVLVTYYIFLSNPYIFIPHSFLRTSLLVLLLQWLLLQWLLPTAFHLHLSFSWHALFSFPCNKVGGSTSLSTAIFISLGKHLFLSADHPLSFYQHLHIFKMYPFLVNILPRYKYSSPVLIFYYVDILSLSSFYFPC